MFDGPQSRHATRLNGKLRFLYNAWAEFTQQSCWLVGKRWHLWRGRTRFKTRRTPIKGSVSFLLNDTTYWITPCDFVCWQFWNSLNLEPPIGELTHMGREGSTLAGSSIHVVPLYWWLGWVHYCGWPAHRIMVKHTHIIYIYIYMNVTYHPKFLFFYFYND